MPFIALRRYCLFVRSAAAGTPTTARTFDAVDLPFALDADQAAAGAEQLAHGFDVLLRAFLDQAALERAVEVEHGAVRDRLVADQDLALEDLLRHHVHRPADEAVDDEALAVRRGDRAPRGAEVDPDVEDLGSAIRSGSFLLRRRPSALA